MPTKPPTFKNTMTGRPSISIKSLQKSRRDNEIYDSRWRKFRKWFMGGDTDGVSNQLCHHCYKAGIIKLADVLDHIVPTRVDPTRVLDESNIQPLCILHHSAKTEEDYKKYPDIYGKGRNDGQV